MFLARANLCFSLPTLLTLSEIQDAEPETFHQSRSYIRYCPILTIALAVFGIQNFIDARGQNSLSCLHINLIGRDEMLLTKKSAIRALYTATAIQLFAAPAVLAGEVTVWFWDPKFNGAAMEEAASRYKAIAPDTTITLVDLAKGDLETKLQTQLASGVTDGLPDIVLIDDLRAQLYLQSFDGAFESLNGAIDYTQFAPYKVGVATVGDKTYSLPFDSGVAGLYYRSDILAEAGYKPEDLTNITWDRFIEIGIDVKTKTGHPLLTLDMGNPSPIRMMLQSAGSWYFTPEGELNLIGNPAFKKTIETYAKILQAGNTLWKPVTGWAEYTGSFTSGEVAAVPMTGVWITGTVKSATDQAGKWSVAPVPRLDIEGAINATNHGGSSWYVLSSSAEKAEAVDFLAQVWAKDADFYQKILVDQGAFATFLPAREGQAYASTDDFFGGQAVWKDFSTWVQQIKPVNYGIFAGEVDAAILAQFPAMQAGDDIDGIIAAIAKQSASSMQ